MSFVLVNTRVVHLASAVAQLMTIAAHHVETDTEVAPTHDVVPAIADQPVNIADGLAEIATLVVARAAQLLRSAPHLVAHADGLAENAPHVPSTLAQVPATADLHAPAAA